jgi:hypothetical protein
MTCDVCLGGYGGHVDFFTDTVRRSRKQRVCYEGGHSIQAGEKYHRLYGKCDGQLWSANVCMLCFEINEVFSCGQGMEFGGLWESMYDYVFSDLRVTSPCLHKLSQPAREFLMAHWWKWKEMSS